MATLAERMDRFELALHAAEIELEAVHAFGERRHRL